MFFPIGGPGTGLKTTPFSCFVRSPILRSNVNVSVARQALAIDERRTDFRPEIWRDAHTGQSVEQRWFPGSHGDVGGQLGGLEAARPLSNLSLVWMLEKAEGAGLTLPKDWHERFPCDASAPSVGSFRGFGKLFLLRARRRVGCDPSETFHPAINRPADLAHAAVVG